MKGALIATAAGLFLVLVTMACVLHSLRNFAQHFEEKSSVATAVHAELQERLKELAASVTSVQSEFRELHFLVSRVRSELENHESEHKNPSAPQTAELSEDSEIVVVRAPEQLPIDADPSLVFDDKTIVLRIGTRGIAICRYDEPLDEHTRELATEKVKLQIDYQLSRRGLWAQMIRDGDLVAFPTKDEAKEYAQEAFEPGYKYEIRRVGSEYVVLDIDYQERVFLETHARGYERIQQEAKRLGLTLPQGGLSLRLPSILKE